MNLKIAFTIVLLNAILLFAFSYCTRPKETYNGGIPVKEIENQSNALEPNRNVPVFEADSAASFRLYLNLSSRRIEHIEEKLSQISSRITLENSDMALALGGEVFQFNKKSLELKTIIRQSLDNTDTSIGTVEATLTEELDILEASVSDFKERNDRNK